MKSRSSLVIMAIVVCQLLVHPGLVTSQLPSAGQSSPEGSQSSISDSDIAYAYSSQQGGEEALIYGVEKEYRKGIWFVRGNAELKFRSYDVQADEMTYDSNSGEATLSGHVLITGGPNDEHIAASHGTYNVQNESGKLYDVVGSLGIILKGKNVILRSAEPLAFTGAVVEKKDATHYVLSHGTITSCKPPKPKWTFNAPRVKFEAGEQARIFNSTFRVGGIPVMFFPYAEHPVQRAKRHSGFLLPTYGTSTHKGTIFGDSYFWAINRSMDATIGGELYSELGSAQHAIFRANPTRSSWLDVTYFGVVDRTKTGPRAGQGGENIRFIGGTSLPFGFRAAGSGEYLSSYVFRLAFSETFAQAINSEVKSKVFATRSNNGFSINALAARYQNFQSPSHGDLVTILHAPSLEFGSVDRTLAKTPIYWNFDAAAESLSRKEPGFVTNNVVGRFDIHPRLSAPVFLHGWTFRPGIGVRDTYYTQRRLPSVGLGIPGKDPVNRRDLEWSFELRPPTLGRVFEHPIFRRQIKHTIEPRIVYRYVNGIENFQDIIRFDSRDIVSDTNEVEIGLVNRVFAKRTRPNCSTAAAGQPNACPLAREFLTWEVAQKYYLDPNFGGALINGRRNAITASTDLTGIAFLTEPRRWSPIVSRLRAQITPGTNAQWQLDYDGKKGRISSSNLSVGHRFGEFFLGGEHYLLLTPGEIFTTSAVPSPDKFNQYRATGGYGNPSRIGFNVAGTFSVDAHFSSVQYIGTQVSYNWDCCGLNFEYRTFGLGSVRHENQYRIAFSIANIGSFGNLRPRERIF